MFLIFLVYIAALTLEVIGSYMSIVGLASKTGPLIIALVITLDFAKVVIATVLYKSWKSLNWALRIIFLPACIILVLVTSSGAYGYILREFGKITNDSEKDRIVLQINQEEKEKLEARKKSLEDQVTQLPANYVRQRANLMNTFKPEMDEITARLEEINQSIRDAKTSKFDSTNDSTNSTIASLAKVYNIPPDQVNRILAFFITFMIDPLAIALLTLANFLSSQRREKIENTKIKEYIEKTRAEKIKELIFGKNIPIDYPKVEVSFKDVYDENIPLTYLKIHSFINSCKLEDPTILTKGALKIDERNAITDIVEDVKKSTTILTNINFIKSCHLKEHEDSIFDEPLISPYALNEFKFLNEQTAEEIKKETSDIVLTHIDETPDTSFTQSITELSAEEEQLFNDFIEKKSLETINFVTEQDLEELSDMIDLKEEETGFDLTSLQQDPLTFDDNELKTINLLSNHNKSYNLEHLWIDDPVVREAYEEENSGFYKK